MAITVPDVANIADGGHTTDHNTIRTALLALDASLAAVDARQIVGNRVVFLGDSTTAGANDNSANSHGEAWPVYASLSSQGRIIHARNAGFPSDNTTQMLARFTADVTPYQPNSVILLGGTNDAGQGVALATFQANVISFIAACKNINATPILCTILPNNSGTPSNRKRDISRYNQWLKRYSAKNTIHLLDFYELMIDTSTGGIITAYKSDETHPNAVGYAVMGNYVSAALSSALPTSVPFLPAYNTEVENLVPGGLFLVDTNSDGVSDGFGPAGGGAGTVWSRITDSVVLGKMQRVTQTAGNLAWIDSTPSITAGWTVGDTIALTGRVSKTTGLNASIWVDFTGSGKSLAPMYTLTGAIDRGTFYEELVIPASTTGMFVRLVAGAGTGTVDWGQIGLFNLTTMGALA